VKKNNKGKDEEVVTTTEALELQMHSRKMQYDAIFFAFYSVK